MPIITMEDLANMQQKQKTVKNRPQDARKSAFPGPRPKNQEPEYHLQCQVVQWLNFAHPSALFTISPAGLRMSMFQGKKMKAMGYRKGTPDLIILQARGRYYGLLAEIKDRAPVSSAQHDFMDAAKAAGYKTVICYGLQDAIDKIGSYLSSPPMGAAVER